jgi:hypoxanthine phosphoribosyltransferase
MIKINDLYFEKYIDKETIDQKVESMAKEIEQKLDLQNTVCLILLNGAFIFAADLLRKWKNLDLETKFIKISSYQDTKSTGNVLFEKNLASLQGKNVLIIEDIIDSGNTLHQFCNYLDSLHIAKLTIASLLLKPDNLLHNIKADFVGFTIPDLFVIGYGLDYNNHGRNLEDIYILKANED